LPLQHFNLKLRRSQEEEEVVERRRVSVEIKETKELRGHMSAQLL